VTIREVVRRLRAFEDAKPAPRYETMHIKQSSEALLVAFVRMGGETRPWAIAWGKPGKEPSFSSVTDPRNREAVEQMIESFARDLLAHFRIEGFSLEPIQERDFEEDKVPALVKNAPQIWLPGPSHLDMVHYLSYAYWRVRDDDDRTKPNHALSRFCGWLFRENSSMGQQSIIDASKAVREAYVFPTDDFSLTHLGSQQVWLISRGDYQQKLLASRESAKEQLGITMDPKVEVKLQELLVKARKATSTNDAEDPVAAQIASKLREESLRRWSSLDAAYRTLEEDDRPENKGVEELVLDSLQRFYFNFQQQELRISDPNLGPVFTPHPETDHHGSTAAWAYYLLQAADSKFLPTLVHDDEELLNESLADGHSIRGLVTQVLTQTNGRAVDIFWKIQCENAADDFRMRTGEYLSPFGNKSQQVKTVGVDFVALEKAEVVEVTIQWGDGKTHPVGEEDAEKPDSQSWLGRIVTFVPFDNSSFDKKASQAVWNSRTGSGSWLTHSKAQRFPDEKVIDDVIQIEGFED
jgi:hypothetical protein